MANAFFRPIPCASLLNMSIPKNAPIFCTIKFAAVHHCLPSLICAGLKFCALSAVSMAGVTNAPLKKPTPQRPTTPETHSNIPSKAELRQRLSPNKLP